jgi:hypothetical protein
MIIKKIIYIIYEDENEMVRMRKYYNERDCLAVLELK